MRVLVGKAHDLVFDRRTVSRPDAADGAAVKGRASQVILDDPVRLTIRMGDRAADLLRLRTRAQIGEHHRLVIARLLFQNIPGNGRSLDPRWRTGFQPAQGKPETLQTFAQLVRRPVAPSTCLPADIADVNRPAQKGSGGQDDRPAPDLLPVGQPDTLHLSRISQQRLDFAHDEIETGICAGQIPSRLTIQITVHLGARSLDRWPLPTVQKPELDACAIRKTPHHAVHCIDLADQMALPQPTNRGIARQGADIFAAHRDKNDRRAGPGGRCRGFQAGMTATDDSNIIMFHVKHPLYFPMQKDENILSR